MSTFCFFLAFVVWLQLEDLPLDSVSLYYGSLGRSLQPMPKEIEFNPAVGKAGLDCKEGNTISLVVKGGQAEKNGVKMGWKVCL